MNKETVFGMYKNYLKVYPEWFMIKKYIDGNDVTILSKFNGCEYE